MSTFRVGQKVVCVDASSAGYGGIPKEMPVQGSCYTVYSPPFINVWDNWAVNIAELEYQDPDIGWRASRFRPLLDADLEEQVNELEEQTVEA